jgi:hypothetical protein
MKKTQQCLLAMFQIKKEKEITLTLLVHLFYDASRYDNISRYIIKWMNKKVKMIYNLERRKYLKLTIALKMLPSPSHIKTAEIMVFFYLLELD